MKYNLQTSPVYRLNLKISLVNKMQRIYFLERTHQRRQNKRCQSLIKTSNSAHFSQLPAQYWDHLALLAPKILLIVLNGRDKSSKRVRANLRLAQDLSHLMMIKIQTLKKILPITQALIRQNRKKYWFPKICTS